MRPCGEPNSRTPNEPLFPRGCRNKAIVSHSSWLFPFALCALVGCAGVTVDAEYDRAADHISNSTGHDDVYKPGDEDLIESTVAKLLIDGLDLRESVQVCLLNNPNLQATFLQIGIAKADFVQSGLISNPSLGLVFRFPSGGGPLEIEGGIAQSVADLWRLPARKAASERELNQTILKVSHEITILAGRARNAHISTIAADEAMVAAAENVQITKELLELVVARQDAGDGNALDVHLARGEFFQAELELQRAQLRMYDAKYNLAMLLGLTLEPSEILLSDDLPIPTESQLDADVLIRAAHDHRLDIRAFQEAQRGAEERLRYEERSVFGQVSPSLQYERNDGTSSLGPGFQLRVPVFDQNQAQIAKARLRYQQAQKFLSGLRLSVTQSVRAALMRAEAAHKSFRFYEEHLLPNRSESLELAREAYRIGQSSFLAVVEAQRSLLEARRESNDQLLRVGQAYSRLEQEIGRPIRDFKGEHLPGSGE